MEHRVPQCTSCVVEYDVTRESSARDRWIDGNNKVGVAVDVGRAAGGEEDGAVHGASALEMGGGDEHED